MSENVRIFEGQLEGPEPIAAHRSSKVVLTPKVARSGLRKT
jgi:hypothetical protein